MLHYDLAPDVDVRMLSSDRRRNNTQRIAMAPDAVPVSQYGPSTDLLSSHEDVVAAYGADLTARSLRALDHTDDDDAHHRSKRRRTDDDDAPTAVVRTASSTAGSSSSLLRTMPMANGRGVVIALPLLCGHFGCRWRPVWVIVR